MLAAHNVQVVLEMLRLDSRPNNEEERMQELLVGAIPREWARLHMRESERDVERPRLRGSTHLLGLEMCLGYDVSQTTPRSAIIR